jgi:isopropylmalate/homocitrate/citramalate synthase
MPYTSGISTEITAPAAWSQRITGFPVQPNKAIVGANAFAHEAASIRTACSRRRHLRDHDARDRSAEPRPW